MMYLQISSTLSAIVVLLIFSVIQETSANKKVPCDKTGCKNEHEYCDLSTGKCTPRQNCPPCKKGYLCHEGKCIAETDCSLNCPPGEECYLQQVQCFRAPCYPIPTCRSKCEAVTCPKGEKCHEGKCITETKCNLKCPPGEVCDLLLVNCLEGTPCKPKPICRSKCDSVKCPKGEICENGKCVEDKCASKLCIEGTVCHYGACYKPCEDQGPCEAGKKCFRGSKPQEFICKEDKCAVVRCASGTECIDGKCIKKDRCL